MDAQHLTILGDRQAGKTKLLVDIAIDEAGRQGRDVLFFTASYHQDSWTHQLILDRAKELVPDLIDSVKNANGRQSITFTTGGRIRYRTGRHERPQVDTHIIDDLSGGDSDVGATRIFRAMIR